MNVEDNDVESSLIALQFTQQKVRNEQATHHEESIDSYCCHCNYTVKLPLLWFLLRNINIDFDHKKKEEDLTWCNTMSS